jgi:DAK2 domain fusion protein YloV
VLEALDAAAIRRWSDTVLGSLRAHQAEIDALNVFPVPDSDTGTNLVLTFQAADAAVRARSHEKQAGEALRVMAEAAVLGARGNSGVIVSQLLRGFAVAADGCVEVDSAVLGRGLLLGSQQAHDAVAEPVEGTILSVCRAAAEAAAADVADGGADDLATLLGTIVDAAQDALARTPHQLPVLAEAGVVDAGARGYVLILDALERVVTGNRSRLADVAPPASIDRPLAAMARETGSSEFGYEVQYLLDVDSGVDAAAGVRSIDVLRAELAALGDSVVVVGTGTGTWNVHVHVNDIGAAVEAGLRAGRPHQITVTRFSEEPTRSGPRVAIIAVAPGDGVAHLFEGEGVQVLDSPAPSVAEVLTALRDARADVVLLPNGAEVTGVAEQAARTARGEGRRVVVVPTRSPVQGLAAVAVHDPTRALDDDVVAMAEAAAATRVVEIAVASEEALTSVGICRPGDVLGLIDGEVVGIGHSVLSVLLGMIDRVLGVGAELLTVLVGAEAPAGVGALVTQHVRARSPLTEVAVYTGGQPNLPVIIGVE